MVTAIYSLVFWGWGEGAVSKGEEIYWDKG